MADKNVLRKIFGPIQRNNGRWKVLTNTDWNIIDETKVENGMDRDRNVKTKSNWVSSLDEDKLKNPFFI